LNWYLVQTKRQKERSVHDQLTTVVAEVFLPMIGTWISRRARGSWGTSPLFPCYLFAKFELREQYFEVRYLPGVNGVVSAGREPIPVPLGVVDAIKRRIVDGIVSPGEGHLRNGDDVRVIEGPFRGFEGIFERYLSGAERVAILLGTLQSSGPRVVLPATALSARL
jgi:transcriptional antiterminator RfaH